MSMRIASDTWKRLATEPLVGDALAARPAVRDGSDRVLAALDRSGRRHVLVRLNDSDPDSSDQKSRGIDLSTRELTLSDGSAGRFLILQCIDSLGHDVFDTIGGELVTAIASGLETPDVAAKRALARWRRFWLQAAKPLLTKEALGGLFAELWFLVYWLLPRVGVAKSIDAWKGPAGNLHDFELPSLSVEVKAALGAARRHLINGIDQLSEPGHGRLQLFSLSLRFEASASNSLPVLVDRVRELAKDEDESIVRFETMLSKAGYDSELSEEYDEFKIRVVDERIYRVTSAFPRLTRASLKAGIPQGVGELAYSIDLASAESELVCSNAAHWSIPTSTNAS